MIRMRAGILLPIKEVIFYSNDDQTEMEQNSPVDCLRNRSDQTETVLGRNDIGASSDFISGKSPCPKGEAMELFIFFY